MMGSDYQCLVGILCGGYYLHNISLPIYRSSKHPENNLRDIFLGFFLVFLSYAACGCLGYFGFANGALFPGQSIEQNCLNMLRPDDAIAIIIRSCTFCQLLAATALLFACQRAQILLLLTGRQEASSDSANTWMNLAMLAGPLTLAITYPHVGRLAGIMGALGGFFTIYFVPTATYIKHWLRRRPVRIRGEGKD